jgi:ribosomal protein L3 glutamine methyltransferase
MQTAESWLEYCAGEMKRAGLFFGHGTNNATDEAAWMLLHVLNAPLDGSFDNWNIVLNETQEVELQKLLKRRIVERCPLAYLTGEARFCGLDFIVSPKVLIPRSPVAELIVEQFSPWLKLPDGGRILDMCTGGGCIAIAMAVYMPECKVDAVDISSDALEIAALNIQRHAVGERVRLVKSDLFTELDHANYDLIVSNPPYVSADVFEKLPAEYLAEPSTGLVCGQDGLDIVLKIIDAAPRHLKQQGLLIMEVGESAETLQETLPRVPFFWLDFEQGGDGVFMLEYDQLIACQTDVRAILEQRNDVR